MRNTLFPLLFALLLLLIFPGCDESGGDGDEAGDVEVSVAEAVSEWIERLDDPLPAERLEAVKTLASLGTAAAEAVPALVRALQDRELRLEATRALGNIGPEAREAVSFLVEVLHDRDEAVRIGASIALSKIGADAVPALVEALKQGAERSRPPPGAAAWFDRLVDEKPDIVAVGLVIVAVAFLAAAVLITRLWIRHRERMQGAADAGVESSKSNQ